MYCLSIKRILADLQDLDKNPLQGVSIDIPDLDDPYTLHSNIEIQDGIYKGILLHFIFRIPPDYPNSPPSVNIAPGLDFNHHFHANIFDNYEHGHWFCTGLTNNYADVVKADYDGSNLHSRLAQISAWTSAYTLGSILLHLQVMLSDPDFPKRRVPSFETLQSLKDHVKDYKLKIKVHNANRTCYVTHSYDYPYPQLSLQHARELERTYLEKPKSKIIYDPDNIYEYTVTPNPDYAETLKEVSNKLVCSVSKINIFDKSKPILGYPIDMRMDSYGRFWPYPIIELLSYEVFVTNMQQNSDKLDDFYHTSFRSGLGEDYNYWLPLYIDHNHFERSKSHILNAISVMYGGIEGRRENDFHPHMVLKVLPPILVKTVVRFLKGTLYQSVASIEAYCQIYRLLAKLVEVYPQLRKMIDQEVKNFCASEKNRHKSVAGDLGEFIIKLSLSSVGVKNADVNNFVLRESFARQVSWTYEKDRGLGLVEKCPNLVERFLKASEISNQFILTMIETAKLMLNDGTNCELDERCGILNGDTMKLFRSRLEWIQNNVKEDWTVLVKELGQEKFVPNKETMVYYVSRAFSMAKSKGYWYSNWSSY